VPILDTAVLFAAADPADKYHDDAARHLGSVGAEAIVAGSGLIEFDLVLRARGHPPAARRAEFKRLIAEFPEVETAVGRVKPRTMYVATSLEEGFQLGFFDSLIAAEALAFDGKIVSSDRDFDLVPGLKRIALKGGH
jgi:predicted nucleic acid-binding protein